MLPACDGLEILRAVREIRPTQPVIILTARGEENDRVEGLRLGADDYVVKPFSVKELLARVEAVLRRSPERPRECRKSNSRRRGRSGPLARSASTTAGGMSFPNERSNCCATWPATAAGPFRAMNCCADVWQIDPRGVATRTIDMHITRLREKLRDDPDEPRIVLTVRGKGYMFGGGASNRPWQIWLAFAAAYLLRPAPWAG